jgi:hypothetical protein
MDSKPEQEWIDEKLTSFGVDYAPVRELLIEYRELVTAPFEARVAELEADNKRIHNEYEQILELSNAGARMNTVLIEEANKRIAELDAGARMNTVLIEEANKRIAELEEQRAVFIELVKAQHCK